MNQVKQKAIGGYFGLELSLHPELHAEAMALNSGRFCFEYLLRCRKYKKVYVPYFTCDTAIEPINKLGIPYEFYHIDKEYRIIGDITLAEDEALLYTNYWGLQNEYCEKLAAKYGKQLILDYTQAFFSKPIARIDTFYSCRKYFGVPDGGYLYTDAIADFEVEQDESYLRMDSLIKRIDLSPEAGYEDFHRVSALFHDMPIRRMSKLTQRLMQSIDNERVAQQRIDNYNTLRDALDGRELKYGEVPMIFPYESAEGQELRKHLIANKIFVATYWPYVIKTCTPDMIEYDLASHLIALPIDQRYGLDEMKYILSFIDQFNKIR